MELVNKTPANLINIIIFFFLANSIKTQLYFPFYANKCNILTAAKQKRINTQQARQLGESVKKGEGHSQQEDTPPDQWLRLQSSPPSWSHISPWEGWWPFLCHRSRMWAGSHQIQRTPLEDKDKHKSRVCVGGGVGVHSEKARRCCIITHYD